MIYSSGEFANGIPSQLLRGWGSMHVAGYVLRGHLQKRERAAFQVPASPKEAKGGAHSFILYRRFAAGNQA
jgi:hypothetical protein